MNEQRLSTTSPSRPTSVSVPAWLPARMRGWLNRAWELAGAVSVSTKILGIVLALTVLLGLGVTWQVRLVMQKVFLDELVERGRSLVSDLAARSVDPILLNDTYALYQLLVETTENHPDVLYAFVQEPHGQVLAHTFGQDGFPVQMWRLETMDPERVIQAHTIQHVVFQSEAGRVHEFALPIFEGRAGVVHLGLTETRLLGIVDAVTGQMLLTTMAVAVVGILAAVFLTWLLTRPILELVETTRRVGSGDLSARAPRWANDEIGALAEAFNRMVADLEASRRAIAEKEAARTRLLEQLINAQEEERKRIARELHDGVGQALSSLMVGMKLATQQEDVDAIHAQTEAMRGQVAEILEQVRLLSRQLRPSVLDDLGLAVALERYAEEFRRIYPNFEVDLHCELPGRLPPTIETTLYRIVQEAMTNAARHSGGHTISVLVTRRGNRVRAIIEDDGHGFDPVQARRAQTSVGIHGMAERAELVGGTLDIESSPEGTTVYVEIPLPEENP